MRTIPLGARGTFSLRVTRLHLANTFKDAMLPEVFATPMMIMAMEKASGIAIAGRLPPGWITVGSEVDIKHLAPSPVGRTVTATARVLAVEGRSVLFAVEAHDGERKIGDGRHKRGAVNLERFAERYGF